jgi:hypothetical protein
MYGDEPEAPANLTLAGQAKNKKELNRKRIHNLESSMYMYESSKGKGRWRKDNPVAAKLLDGLLKEEVSDTVEEIKRDMKPEKSVKKDNPCPVKIEG